MTRRRRVEPTGEWAELELLLEWPEQVEYENVLLSNGSSTSACRAISAPGPPGYELEVCAPRPFSLGRLARFVHVFHHRPPVGVDPMASERLPPVMRRRVRESARGGHGTRPEDPGYGCWGPPPTGPGPTCYVRGSSPSARRRANGSDFSSASSVSARNPRSSRGVAILGRQT